MRYRQLLPGVVICVLIVVLVLVLAPTESEPPGTQRIKRLSLQGGDVDQEARGPLLTIEAQRDPIVTLPDAFGTIESLKDVPAVPFKASSVLARAEEPELPRSAQSGVSGPDAVAQTWAGSINMPSPIANFDGVSLRSKPAAVFAA
jgi:hypothetical protein